MHTQQKKWKKCTKNTPAEMYKKAHPAEMQKCTKNAHPAEEMQKMHKKHPCRNAEVHKKCTPSRRNAGKSAHPVEVHYKIAQTSTPLNKCTTDAHPAGMYKKSTPCRSAHGEQRAMHTNTGDVHNAQCSFCYWKFLKCAMVQTNKFGHKITWFNSRG